MTKAPQGPMSEAVADANHPAPTNRYRNYVLAVLVVVYMMNFIDRQILSVLAVPIKKELGLSDTQLGLLHGLAFAILYTTLGIPIAALADRSSRRRIMSWALGIWSAFTVVCGFITGFWSMFFSRVGVGVGEAGGVAPAYSFIADYFPKHQRARAMSIYSLGIPLGMALGILIGTVIAVKIGWRAAFIIVGSLGLVVAPVLRLSVRDPKRGGWDTTAVSPPAPALTLRSFVESFREVAAIVARKPTFWLLSFGAAASSVCGYGLAAWLPSFFIRSYKLSLTEMGVFYASITLIGGCCGILGGGILADRIGKRTKSSYPLIPAVSFLIGLPCFFFAVSSSSLAVAFPLFLIPTALNLVWLGPIVTAVQHLVPAHMRTRASAMFLLINNLIGIAVGTYYFGAMSDRLRPHFGAESLRYAIYSGLGFYVIASMLFMLASRKIKKDWVD
jgi:MFS family permease